MPVSRLNLHPEAQSAPELNPSSATKSSHFDTQLINTAAYRRVLQSHQRAASDQGQSSQDSGPSASTSGSSLARLFGNSVKKEEVASSPHSTGKGVSTGGPQGSKNETRLVEPSSEHIVRDYEDGLATAKDVRDVTSIFYKAMALHREILAMKFVDKSYEGVLAEKVMIRDMILNTLRRFCTEWDTDVHFDGTDEREVLGEIASVFLPRLMRSLEKKPGTESAM